MSTASDEYRTHENGLPKTDIAAQDELVTQTGV
jgi:hypothetical protein